jgi:hypothetical protein
MWSEPVYIQPGEAWFHGVIVEEIDEYSLLERYERRLKRKMTPTEICNAVDAFRSLPPCATRFIDRYTEIEQIPF